MPRRLAALVAGRSTAALRPPEPLRKSLWRVALPQLGAPEDGDAGSLLVLPNGTDIVSEMCDVENYIFVEQKEHNSSCLMYVVAVEKAYMFCNNETDTKAPGDLTFPKCFKEHLPNKDTEEVCQDLVNATDLEAGGNGGHAYERCFLDSSMVHRCLGQCTAKDTKYQFSECLASCYGMNLTARLIRPTLPPTTPPIPEHLIPLYTAAFNATSHLDKVSENLKNASAHAIRASDFLNQNLSNWWNTTTTTAQPLSNGEWNTLQRLTSKLLPYESSFLMQRGLKRLLRAFF